MCVVFRVKLLYEDKRSHRLSLDRRLLDFPPHMHNAIEIAILTKGHCKVNIENCPTQLDAGDIAVIFPNLVHSYENSVDTESFLLILPTTPLLAAYSKLLTEQIPVVPCIRRGEWEHTGLSMLIQQAWKDKGTVSEAVMQGYYLVIVGKLLQLLELKDIGSGTQNALKTMLLYIHDHYREPLARRELAKIVGYNESYISHVFAQTLRTNYTDYVRSLRIQDAVELLTESNMSITQIASSLGFGTIRSFNRAFRQETGMSPRDYRTVGRNIGN